ncbi:hypothetical protein F2Q68_00033103 [Brassica cretica]|uniref:Uncharacterized protein n=1 Tax=Brassica cretica TaxID=69181 RepID=A0A8S9GET9_BRACR|nr:hypothetical protein F2Q68_00033103 [Brassica cretica]
MTFVVLWIRSKELEVKPFLQVCYVSELTRLTRNDGPLGFGGGGGGDGKGWNYGGGGGWDESLSWSWSDPAMEFVYEVICWIALSNCVHFAFERIVRIVTDGEREKLSLTLSPVC